MLDKEYTFYKNNKAELLRKYEDKFIVIISESVVGVYNSETEAYNDSVSKHKLGTFLIQHCVKNEEEAKQIFHSRVIF